MIDPRQRAQWERARQAQDIMHSQRRYSRHQDDPATPTSAEILDPIPAEPASQPYPVVRLESALPRMTKQEQARRWATVRRQFREYLRRMAAYETDPALAIDFPAFNDVAVPEVRTMVKALRTATGLEDSSDQDADVGGSAALLGEFESAVQEFGATVDTAERAARRIQWKHLPEQDQKDLNKVKGLLAHAEDPGNTAESRHGYYAQLQRVIRRLNDRHGVEVISTQVMAEIETKARLELGRS